MSDPAFAELADAEERFSRAIVTNDVTAIASCMSEDWTLVTPEVGPVSRAGFLEAVETGTLTHDSMTKAVERVKVYGDMAVVTGRGQNTGTFKGEPISADEWITDVYRRVDGHWLCVLTHLTPAADAELSAGRPGNKR
jgi:ketosteroid isomerase-like protein